ncbi:MAG: TadE/TadG family type IV pilus assembly protein [Pseudomonas sp.]
MTRLLQLWRLGRRSEASQLVEFAVSLPLLVVFVVGIFDFGQAFNIKLKLSGAVREGARVGASFPTSDLTGNSIQGGGTIDGIRDVVDAYLVSSGLNDCGLQSYSGTQTGGTLTWVYMASGGGNGGCPGPLILTINRGFAFKTTVNANQVDLICTQVMITYPFAWHFNSVIQLLVPGASYAGITQIPSDALVPNLD